MFRFGCLYTTTSLTRNAEALALGIMTIWRALYRFEFDSVLSVICFDSAFASLRRNSLLDTFLRRAAHSERFRVSEPELCTATWTSLITRNRYCRDRLGAVRKSRNDLSMVVCSQLDLSMRVNSGAN